MIVAIIVLPGNVLVIIPGIMLWLTRETRFGAQLARVNQVLFWAGLVLITTGLALAVWTVRLFLTHGQGTPAPWEPPQKLVVLGPYRHVRNPMISGALFMLMGEVLLFQSVPLLVWWLIFLLGNLIYLPKVEERNLLERYGEKYAQYMAQVPRWLPRLQPWTGASAKLD
jgi:protein-S-isoprenylcysteine O-methyltransferase Ste14